MMDIPDAYFVGIRALYKWHICNTFPKKNRKIKIFFLKFPKMDTQILTPSQKFLGKK